MNATQFGQLVVRCTVIATIAAVTCTLAQHLVTGEANAAVTAGVTGSLTALLGYKPEPNASAEPEQAAEHG